MKKELFQADRENALAGLMSEFKRDEGLSLEVLSELESQLTPAEAAICADTLAIHRVRALTAAGKMIQAYQALVQGFQLAPRSVSLQSERPFFLSALQEYLLDQQRADPLGLVIPLVYDILKKEGYLHVWHQMAYLKYLIGQGQLSEAARLAVPLVSLYPNLLGLRGEIEKIAERSPHPAFQEYLLRGQLRFAPESLQTPLEVNDLFVLTHKHKLLREALGEAIEPSILERMIREVVGDWQSGQPMKASLKDFYYMLGIVEERKENYFESLMIFRALVELDPCNLKYRRSMETELRMLCSQYESPLKEGATPVDLVAIYDVVKELGYVSFLFLEQVALAEIRRGLNQDAKTKMRWLVSLNPCDSDYVQAAMTVAEAAQDESWLAELHRLMHQIRTTRPWDIELQMTVTADVAVAG